MDKNLIKYNLNSLNLPITFSVLPVPFVRHLTFSAYNNHITGKRYQANNSPAQKSIAT